MRALNRHALPPQHQQLLLLRVNIYDIYKLSPFTYVECCPIALHIVVPSYREFVISTNMPKQKQKHIYVLDAFECCEVFVLSIGAVYAPVVIIYVATVTCGINDLKRSDGFLPVSFKGLEL